MAAFAGQAAVDALFLAGATIFTLITLAYIAMLWTMRRDFCVLLRSPLLTCAFGFFIVLRYMATTYEYVFIWRGDDIGKNGVVDLIGFPALLTAEIALVMTAVRLLVMYYPRKRAKWGRYVKEKFLIRALGCAWLLMEIAVWSSALAMGISRTAGMVRTVRPLSICVTVFAAAWLAWRLKNVRDSTNLSRDIRLVGKALAAIICLFAVLRLVPTPPPLAFKYAHIVFLSVSSPPILYIINIRPVRQVLRDIPAGGRTTAEKLLAPRHRRTSSSTVDGVERQASGGGENRLATIMSFLPLRKAFGEFCRKALCSESFEFLVDVAKFKALDRSPEGGNDELTHDFARFLAIVNCYIKYDSHLEINIGSDVKRDIAEFIKFEVYASLDPEGRRQIFDPAEAEIIQLLRENLLGKFLASDEYKAVVDLDSR